MTSLSLSFELICLINWLLKHERKLLDNLVKHALKNGLAKELKTFTHDDVQQASDELYTVILDFLVVLEESLSKTIQTTSTDTKTDKAIFPALSKIDADNIDWQALKTSMQQTKDELSKEEFKDVSQSQYKQHATKILFQQFLKNWKPQNNEVMH
jgi:hypothetical protein